MTAQLTSAALYVILLPIFVGVGSIALGVLSLVIRSRWTAGKGNTPKSAPDARRRGPRLAA
jgi:hypothetical protein